MTNAADILIEIMYALYKGESPFLILAEDSPLMEAARDALKPREPYQSNMLDEAVRKFLCWKLPENFHPDGGISFIPPPEHERDIWWPVGTNLFNAEQAKAMIKNTVGDVITEQEATIAALREQLEKAQSDLRFVVAKAAETHRPAYDEQQQVIMDLREQLARMESAIRWACGETNFPARKEGEGQYYWRTELRERSGVPYVPPIDPPEEPK